MKLAALCVVLSALAAACGGGDAEPAAPIATTTPGPSPESTGASSTPVPSPTPDVATPLQAEARTLASGELRLPAAGAFGDPGFHEVLTADQTLPADLGETAGRTLVLRLWDAGRPEVACGRDHPLSGCATVDWSDAPSRPKVPPGGAFRSSVSLQLASGAHTLFLSDTDRLTDEADAFKPG